MNRLLLAISLQSVALMLLAGCGERKVPSAEKPVQTSPATQPAAAPQPSQPPAPSQAADSTPPAIVCRPDITPEQCAQANTAMEQEAKTLAGELSAQGKADEARQKELEAQRPSLSDLSQRECELQRATLAALKRLVNSPAGEIVPPEEAAALPANIARTERFIANNCQ